MPISPDKRALYPSNWREISARVRARSGGRCECTGECGLAPHVGRCGNIHGEPNLRTGSKVVLTTAHLDHDPTSDDESRMKAMCQGCHLAYDREQHRASSADTRARRADVASGQQRLKLPEAR